MKILFLYSLIISSVFLFYRILLFFQKEREESALEGTEPCSREPWNILFLVFLLKLGLIVLLLSTGYTTQWKDDPSRWTLSLNWSKSPWFAPPDHVWLGMSFYIYGTAMKIIPDGLLATRIANMVISLASLFSIYFFSSRVLKNKWAGILSAFILCSLPMHSWLSVMTMSDLVFLVFEGLCLGIFLSYVWHFSRGEIKKAKRDIIFLVLACFGLTGTRYEGWVLGGCILLAFWLHWFFAGANKKEIGWGWLLGTSMGIMLYPLLWMLSSWIVLGSPLAFFTSQAKLNEIYASTLRSNTIYERLLRYPKELYIHFGLLLPFSVVGIILIFLKARKKPIAAIGAGIVLLFFLLMETSVLVGGTSMGLSRCVLYFIFPCLAFAFAPLISILESRDLQKKIKILMIILLGFPFMFYFGKNIKGTFEWRTYGWNGEGIVLAKYLQAELRNRGNADILRKGDQVLIWSKNINESSHLYLKKLCADPKRVLFEGAKDLPAYHLENQKLLIIAHKRELREAGWEELRRIGDYRIYRLNKKE